MMELNTKKIIKAIILCLGLILLIVMGKRSSLVIQTNLSLLIMLLMSFGIVIVFKIIGNNSK